MNPYGDESIRASAGATNAGGVVVRLVHDPLRAMFHRDYPAKHTGDSRTARTTLLITGWFMGEERPDPTNKEVVGYWNPTRRALRLRCPDPVKPWRTIAQGIEGTGAAEVHGYRACDYVAKTVLVYQPASGFHVYIVLPDGADGSLKWWKLNNRDDNLTTAVWDSETYARDETTVTGTSANVSHTAHDTPDAGRTTTVANETKLDKIKTVLMTETYEAAWRSAATQTTRTARDLLMVSLKKAMPRQRLMIAQIKKVLETPVGEAAFGYALGVAMELKAGPEDSRRKRLARELRIRGEDEAFTAVLNPIREFLTTGIDTMLNGMGGLPLPEMPAEIPASLPAPTRVESFEATASKVGVPSDGKH